jgi:hypothetical protein
MISVRPVNVEVFSTNLANPQEADQLREVLNLNFPECRITFDLEDCDRILRMEGIDIDIQMVIQLSEGLNFRVRELAD